MAQDKADKGGEAPETELDVRLPGKIAVSHAAETFDERETLPAVSLPGKDAFAAPKKAPLDESLRTTELVDLPRLQQRDRRRDLYLVLLGAALGAVVTLAVVGLIAAL